MVISNHTLIAKNGTPSLWKTSTHCRWQWNWLIASSTRPSIKNWTSATLREISEFLRGTKTNEINLLRRTLFPSDNSITSTGATGYIQYFIHDILLGRIGKDMTAYLGDIMALTKEGENHKQTVAEILEIFSKHNLWLNLRNVTSPSPKFNTWAW